MKRDGSVQSTSARVREVVATLERLGKKKTRDEMAPRYGIVTDKAFGVSMAEMKAVAKPLGRDHALALALWDTGWYEARTVATLVADPARVTAAQMDAWCRAFDNWAICDTVCFHLFDRSPLALRKIAAWSKKPDEFVKRAAFALLASVALHDHAVPDAAFVEALDIVERGSTDDRNFVKKAVSWALRAIGRRNTKLRGEATKLARRLVTSSDKTAQWVGKDALRDLAKGAAVVAPKRSRSM